jgi:hypothetical protein
MIFDEPALVYVILLAVNSIRSSSSSGTVSIQTTDGYLGCKQKLRIAVNDKIGI